MNPATFQSKHIKPVAGHHLTPNIPGVRFGRMSIVVSDEDYTSWKLAGYGGAGTEVTDLITGSTLTLRRADCGAGCACRTEIVSDVDRSNPHTWYDLTNPRDRRAFSKEVQR